MTHPEVRAIAEEALKEVLAEGKPYNVRPAQVYISRVSQCEDEDGALFWRVDIDNGQDGAFDRMIAFQMAPKMQGERLEVRSEW